MRVAARSKGSRRKSLHRHDSYSDSVGRVSWADPMLDIAVAIEKASTRTAGTTTMDVGSWLQSLGLEKYERAFRENDVDAEVLAHLTADDLISIGVASVGHRRKLLAAIGALATDATVAITATPPLVPAPADAERRQLTVMFCDLVGSTALATRLDPEDLREVVGAYHRAVNETIAPFEGFVAKYMGDGVLIYFGYPQAHEDDAERAVRAGLAVIAAIGRLDLPERLQTRLGIATGLVVVGDLIGAGAAQERGVVGETPNLAARLQALARTNSLVIADATRRQIGALFEFEDLGPQSLAGFAEPQRVWRVSGESGVVSRFEALRGELLTPFVGREEEIELLLRRWQQATGGEGQVVLLTGEAGIGKSRLLSVLRDRLAAEAPTRLRYFCSPHHQDSALYPVIAQLEQAAGFRREDTVETRLDKLEALLALAPPRVEDFAILAELLSLPLEQRYPTLVLSAQRKKERAFEVLLHHLEALTRRQPVLFFYEDLHWIDPSSRELLDRTIERTASLPMLLIATHRPEFVPPWSGLPQVTTVTLRRLEGHAGAAIVERIAGAGVLSREVAAEIVERADGVPLFVEELTKAVLEVGGSAEGIEKTLASVSPSSTAVPSVLHAPLMARLDRLGPRAKEIAQIAAAIGREFSYQLLAPVAARSTDDLEEALGRLSDAGLVFSRGIPPAATYTFKHALVRDAAYASLLRRRREELHARITTVLEEHFTDVVEYQPELLANHCTLGGLTEKAIAYWGIAGRKSVARSAMVEAVSQLRKGLDLLPNVPDDHDRWSHERELQGALGAALYASQGPGAPETGQAYTRARYLCEQLGDTAALIPVLSGLWSHHSARSEYQIAREIAGDLLRFAERKNDVSGMLVANRSMGTCLYILGEFLLSRKYFQKVLTLYDTNLHGSIASVAAYDPRVAALSYLSWNLLVLGYPDQALSWSHQSLLWGRQLGHPHSLGYALTWAAILNLLRRGDQDALRLLEELTTLCSQHGFSHFLARANIMRGYVLSASGETEKGVALARQGFADMLSTGVIWNQTFFLGLMAQSCERAGQLDEASSLLSKALEIANRTGERWFESELHRLRGEWLVARDQSYHGEAETCFHCALEIAKKQNAGFWELRAAMNLSSLWSQQRTPGAMRKLLANVYARFGEGFDTVDLRKAKSMLDDLDVTLS